MKFPRKNQLHRVVTRDWPGDRYCVVFEGTRRLCRAYVTGRWGHHPSFAAITTRQNHFERLFSTPAQRARP